MSFKNLMTNEQFVFRQENVLLIYRSGIVDILPLTEIEYIHACLDSYQQSQNQILSYLHCFF